MAHLVIFSHKLFRHTPEGYQTTGAFAIQVDALAAHFESVTLCVPMVEDGVFRGVGLMAPNVGFHPLPFCPSRVGAVMGAPSIWREVRTVAGQADLALVVLPGYIGSLASILCQRYHVSTFQWVVGDWGRNVLARRSRWLGHWLALTLWKPLLDGLMRRLTRDVLTFFNGRDFYGQGKPHHLVRVSSSIRETDIWVRDDVPVLPPYRLLFVGRLSGEKGVAYLLEAVVRLLAEGIDVRLDIVGTGPLESELRRRAQALSIGDRTTFHGFVPQGESLRRIYRECDVFVLPSLQDLQPKVLMEAMSQGLPVIATDVGEVSSIVRDGENGLLVPPARPEAICEAVLRLLTGHELTRRLIAEGIAHVREHTVEAETARMMAIVADQFGLESSSDETNDQR